MQFRFVIYGSLAFALGQLAYNTPLETLVLAYLAGLLINVMLYSIAMIHLLRARKKQQAPLQNIIFIIGSLFTLTILGITLLEERLK